MSRRTRSRRSPQSSDIDSRWYAEQRNRNGTVRRYWQPRGQPPVRLTDDLDWPKQITALNRQRDAEHGKTVVVDGTVAWVIQKYRESDDFKELAEASTKVYERWLGELEKLFGMLPVSTINRKVAVDFVDVYKDKPSTQKHVYAVLFNILDVARYHGLIVGENPAAKMKLSAPARRDQIWTPDDCAAWLAIAREHPTASMLVPYFVLMLYTAQRPGDVLALQWTQYDGQWVEPHRVCRRLFGLSQATIASSLICA